MNNKRTIVEKKEQEKHFQSAFNEHKREDTPQWAKTTATTL